MIARRSDGLLLLTATPHDGYDPHFASLIELLDPSLVDGRGGLAGSAYRRHVVRRLKSPVRDPETGAPQFRERRVIPVRVEIFDGIKEPVRRFHQALAALIVPTFAAGRSAEARIRRCAGICEPVEKICFDHRRMCQHAAGGRGTVFARG